jgi:hypothetical protein
MHIAFRKLVRTRFSIVTAFIVCGCGSSTSTSGFESDVRDTEPPQQQPAEPAPGPTGSFGQGQPAPTDDQASQIAEVFGHSALALYKLDPITLAVTVIGTFDDCGQVTDIALDEKSDVIGVTQVGLFRIDKTTAHCTPIAGGSYPNSLSFVPKGTVDPAEEALVGYNGPDYIRIDLKTGAQTKIGSTGGTFLSSGDIVSVKGGKTYLTAKGGGCLDTDCLVEVDPTTGAAVHNWGSIGHANVYGLAFWGGKLYGFDEGGELFEVTFGTGTLTTKSITIPAKPQGLSFWGAGSTTSAPLVAPPK